MQDAYAYHQVGNYLIMIPGFSNLNSRPTFSSRNFLLALTCQSVEGDFCHYPQGLRYMVSWRLDW